MPTYFVKRPDGTKVQMPWDGVNPPNTADIDDFLNRSNPQQQSSWKDTAKKLLYPRGTTFDESGKIKTMPHMLQDMDAYNPLPKIASHPTGKDNGLIDKDWWGGFGTGMYNNFIQPLTSPESNIMGMMRPMNVPNPSLKDYPGVAQSKPLRILGSGVQKKTPLELPPMPPEPRFFQGAAGTADALKKYPMDVGPRTPYPGIQQIAPKAGNLGDYRATVLPQETGQIANIPPIQAAEQGTTMGRIPSIRKDSTQEILGSLEAAKTSPMQISDINPNETFTGTGKPNRSLEASPSATRISELTKRKQQIKPTVQPPGPNTIPQAEPVVTPISKNTPYRAIPETASVKDAVSQWAQGREGANVRGSFAREKFKDLTDPSLVDKYEAGDRTGALGDVQKYFDERFQQAKDIGFLGQDQKRLNYLRHYYEQSPEEVSTAYKQYVAKNPKFAKEGTFPTYQAAEEGGLKRKFGTIPEIVQNYEKEFQQAVRNKEFYDYLSKTKQLKPGTTIDNMSGWKFQGPNSKMLEKLVQANVMGKPIGWINKLADAFSISKNISLGGGVPYTKYNMHAYNIARNDAALNGYIKAGKELFTDPTGKKAVDWMANLPQEEKGILADLVDRGWKWRPMEDAGKDVNLFDKITGEMNPENAIGKAALKVGSKALDVTQHATETPLFERALPGLTAQRTLEVFHKLEGPMGREEALKAAAKIGNNFYGGVSKVLRNKTTNDLSRITFLAPDWMESQITKAYSQWKGLAKTAVGKGTPVDKMYAKSLGRSAVIPSGGALSTLAVGGGVAALRGKKSSTRNIADIDLWTDDKGKQVSVPTLTTANDELRIPLAAPIMMFEGNPGALKDLLIKNRLAIPYKTVNNLVKGQDDFGNPLSGKDKYGKDISFGSSLYKYGAEASKPFQHQMVTALIDWLKGDISGEEAVSRGVELPTAYTSPEKTKPIRKGVKRLGR